MLNSSFLKIFAKSPIKPMQQHMGLVFQCVSNLEPFMQTVLQKNWPASKLELDKINSLENKADILKKDIRLYLPSKILLPISKRDFVELLKSQDLIASGAKRLANLIFYRKMQFPEQLTKSLLDFIHLGVNATKVAQNVIGELDQLIETGFRGSEARLVETMIINLDNINEHTDDIQNSLREELFKLENNLNPIDAIFLYRVIDCTAELADRAQKVGHKLESLLTTQ